MKKNITVILKEKGKNQDLSRSVKKVAMGYAFNYLIPNNMAEIATKGKIKHLNMLHAIVSQNKDLVTNRNIKTKNKLENIRIIHIRKKCSHNQLIFGSISEQDIAIKLSQLTGKSMHKKQILTEAIKQIGRYKIEIVITDNLRSTVQLHVLPRSA